MGVNVGQLCVMLRGSLAAARDRRYDADLVAGLRGSAKAVEEAHILAVDIDIHEVAKLALFVAEPSLDSRILALKRADNLSQRRAVGVHLVCAVSYAALSGVGILTDMLMSGMPPLSKCMFVAVKID